MNLKLPLMKKWTVQNLHVLALIGNICTLWFSMKKNTVDSLKLSKNDLTESPLEKSFHYS